MAEWVPTPVYPVTREDWYDYVALDFIARRRPYISEFARRFRVSGVRLYRWLWRLEERGFIRPIAPRRRIRITWRGMRFLTVRAPSKKDMERLLPAMYEERPDKANPRVRVVLNIVPEKTVDPWIIYNLVWWHYTRVIPPYRNRTWPMEWVIRPAVTPEGEEGVLWYYVGKPVESKFGDSLPPKPIPIFMFEEEGQLRFYVPRGYIEERPISCQISTSRATYIMWEATVVSKALVRVSITIPRRLWPRPVSTWGENARRIEEGRYTLAQLLGL